MKDLYPGTGPGHVTRAARIVRTSGRDLANARGCESEQRRGGAVDGGPPCRHACVCFMYPHLDRSKNSNSDRDPNFCPTLGSLKGNTWEYSFSLSVLQISI